MIQQKLPTAPQERIVLIDALRGLAVLGILLSNILLFSGFVFTPFKELALLKHAWLNNTLYYLSNLFISGKFYPIFCMLFGYGFYMQVAKYGNKNKNFVSYFLRRLFLLLLIGIMHQSIWPGDVITTYALVGFLFLFVRKTTYKQDLYLALTFFVIYLGVGLYPLFLNLAAGSASETTERISHFSFPGIDNYELIEKVRTEGIAGMYFFYKPQYQFLWSVSRLGFVTHSVIALFFLGGYLYKIDFFNKHALKTRNVIIFFLLGATGSFLYFKVAYAFRIFDNVFLSLVYMSLFAIFFKTKTGYKILKNLVPIGRMALSSYILQSVFCIFIFYGFGLKLFSKIPLYQVYIIAISILVTQIIFSKIWLKKYRFGPIEWVWRSLTYRKRIPLKIY